jgi:hypothetical protein
MLRIVVHPRFAEAFEHFGSVLFSIQASISDVGDFAVCKHRILGRNGAIPI